MLHQRLRPGYMNPDNLAWRVLPGIAGGGIFVDMGSHMLDFLDYVLGPIAVVQGIATNQGGYYPAEDNVIASFVFESGVVGIGNWCFTSFQEVDQMEIIGTQGKVTFSAFDETPITLTTAEGAQTFAIANPPHVQQPLIQTIVDELNGVGKCPSTGESGARTARVVDQILADYREAQLAQ
jgi:predicted dehydrogenase